MIFLLESFVVPILKKCNDGPDQLSAELKKVNLEGKTEEICKNLYIHEEWYSFYVHGYFLKSLDKMRDSGKLKEGT